MPIVKKEFYAFWLIDGKGDQSEIVTVDDPSDNLCIFGYDAAGKFHQYDSNAAWYADEWAIKKGFQLFRKKITVNIDTDEPDV